MLKRNRMFLLAIVSVLIVVLAACGSNKTGGNSGGDTDKAKLEFFTYWTAGGEGEALDALMEAFNEKHDDIEVVRATVAGGGGMNAKAVLSSRMNGGDPPSTFQIHSGDELMAWVDADKMEPITSIYEENGWDDIFPDKVIEMISQDGEMWGVTLGLHRGNVLWYNKAIFEEYGLEAPTTFDQFFDVAEELQSHGVTPLALGDKEVWATGMIFENILLAELGAEDYSKLFNGDIPFDSPEVVRSAELLGKMLEYVNDTHSSLEWQDATELVANGEAAMNIMGDWAEGYFQSKDLVANEDYGWVPTPETEGSFMIVDDSFGLPVGLEHEEAAKKFLAFVGSIEAQDIFNPVKGSIPSRTDADPEKYGEYGKDAIASFKAADESNTIAHTVIFESAAPPAFANELSKALTTFITQKNVDSFIQDLMDATDKLN